MDEKEALRQSISDNITAAQRVAFELGFRWAERGMNLQEALAKFDKIMSPKPDESKPNDLPQVR